MSDDEITRQLDAVAAAPRVRAVRTARLIILGGNDDGRQFILGEQSIIGRGAGLAVQLRDSLVSRVHAQIFRAAAGAFVLEDLGSRNGTVLNGKLVAQSPLTFGDQIVTGATTFLFTYRDEAEELLMERQQLEMLGRLGSGLVHDMNNLLSVSLASAWLLRDVLYEQCAHQLPDDVLENVDAIITASERGRGLTEHLLRLAQRQPMETEELDLTALVKETIDLARRVFHRGIEVAAYVDAGIRVVGNRSELHRVLMNLLLNARDAMPERGRLSVSLRAERDHVDPSSTSGEIVARLSVRDSGAGMDEETRTRIFDRLFTTKEHGRGGLGLDAVARIVSAHGGRVRCESALGRGTLMEVVLPRAGVGPCSESQTRLRPPSPTTELASAPPPEE